MEFVFPHDVRGWLTEREGGKLFNLSRNKTVLEIGSFCGRSTICMAQFAKEVHSVDWFMGDPGCGFGEYTLPEFAKNLERYKVHNKVHIHTIRSEMLTTIFQKKIFDMIFFDGDHSEYAARQDFVNAVPLAKDHCVLCFHDIDMKTVQDAFVSVFDFPISCLSSVDNLAYGSIYKGSF